MPGQLEGAEPSSEREVVTALAGIFRRGQGVGVGIGDDAAVLSAHDEMTVVTSDMLVEGVDFERSWASMGDIGWKSVAVNLSDVGAMGADPRWLVVSLGLPEHVSMAEIRDFAGGAQSAVDALAPRASVVGGDLSRAPVVTVSVTVLGTCAGSPVLRSGAGVGDRVAYCGDLGRAAAGLAVLQRGGVDASAEPQVQAAVQAQLRPRPPVSKGREARLAGATALIDVSDGLAIDASRIADASKVTVHLDESAVASSEVGLAWAREKLGRDPRELVMSGGEDFGLLATFPADSGLPEGFRLLGRVGSRGNVPVVLGARPAGYPEWDHFLR